MDFLKDRRIVVLGGGAAVALLAGLGIAAALLAGHDQKQTEAPPASRAGLIVETGRDDDTKLDPARPLRCFVGGAFVGEITLAECAKKNGVATGALDVGVDETGALAAAALRRRRREPPQQHARGAEQQARVESVISYRNKANKKRRQASRKIGCPDCPESSQAVEEIEQIEVV